MKIKTFIEKAIEGGWRNHMTPEYAKPRTKNSEGVWFDGNLPTIEWIPIYQILLDPLAWQAVGKVEGWDKKGRTHTTWKTEELVGISAPKIEGEWLYIWHRMIDALAEGKTIEEFIATL